MAKRRRRPGGRLQAGLALEGALEQIGLPTVLAIFDLERRSGVVTLDSSEGQQGQVQVREGRAVHARVWGQHELRGRTALYQLLDWRRGQFGFRPGFVDAVDELGATTTQLLLDAARQLDEAGSSWEASDKIALPGAPATISVR